MKKVAAAAIRIYQWAVSPLLPPTCRFYPSCSEYAFQAIEKWGLLQGTVLGLKRILKCHPWNPGGLDPVP